MRTSPGASVQESVQVADVSVPVTGEFQVTDADVAVPSANTSDDCVPVLFAALFQFLAGLTPADSLAAIATVPVTPESPGGMPPTKSMLMIMGATPASATVPPVVLVPPVALVPPLAPPVALFPPLALAPPVALFPPLALAPPVALFPPLALVPPVALFPPIALVPPTALVPPIPADPPPPTSDGGGASKPALPVAVAPAAASMATFPAPPAAVPLVPPVVVAPPAPPTAVPPAGTPPIETPPPEPPFAASRPAMTAPPLPPVAASVDTWPPWLTRGCVRSTHAANNRLAAIAGRADVKKRAKFIPSYPKGEGTRKSSTDTSGALPATLNAAPTDWSAAGPRRSIRPAPTSTDVSPRAG